MDTPMIRDKHGVITLHTVHSRNDCKLRHCIIHNPARPLRERLLHWRGDKGYFEDICDHGVGHPTYEDMLYHRKYGRGTGTHACDDCCLDWWIGD